MIELDKINSYYDEAHVLKDFSLKVNEAEMRANALINCRHTASQPKESATYHKAGDCFLI